MTRHRPTARPPRQRANHNPRPATKHCSMRWRRMIHRWHARRSCFCPLAFASISNCSTGSALRSKYTSLTLPAMVCEQMAEILAGRTGIDAIHIISHGAQAELTMGTARLTLDSMNSLYANELAVIGQALSENADLLIYGCNFGEGDLGRQAVSRLAEHTGADVAASVDETGHADLGGDWYLEHETGELETALVLADEAMWEWEGLLAENILESYEPTFASMGDQAYELKSNQSWGQTFVNDSPGATYTVHRIGLVLYQDNAATSQVITASLRSSWNGPVIASGQLSSSSLGTTEAWVQIDLTMPATLTDNASYYIRVDTSSSSGKVYVGVHDAGLYAGGDLIDDSGAPETPKDMAFRIIEATGNADPVVSNLNGDNLAYTEGGGAIVIEQSGNATVSDADSADFDTGNLIVSFVAGSDSAEDVLAIRNQGTGAGQIGVSGNTVTYGGTTIGTVGGGAGGSNLVVTFNSNATPAAAEALIRNVTYENTDTDNPTAGARTVRFVLTDGDGGGSGNHDTTVTVATVNDAPVNQVPGAQTVAEDTALALGGVSVTDVDGNLSTVQLAVANGTVTVSLVGGATISSGANGTTTLTLSGTQAQINAALGTLAYQGTLHYSGPDTLTMTSTDSTAVTDVDTIAITVTAVNDAPVNTVPASQVTNLNTTLVLSAGNSNQVSVDDVDAGAGSLRVTLNATQGLVSLSGTTGLAFSTGDGSNDATMTFTGTITDINNSLNGMAFTPSTGFVGAANLQMITNDQGNTGGAALSVTDNLLIEVVTEQRVNTTVASNQTEPAVAIDALGNYVVTWTSDNQDGGGKGIYAQRFDPAGTPIGAEFRVNTFTAGGSECLIGGDGLEWGFYCCMVEQQPRWR